MILRNGKIIKNTKIKFSNNIKIEYYILRSFEKIQKKIHYDNILLNNKEGQKTCKGEEAWFL